MSIQDFLITYLGLGLLNGMVIYFVFYYMFQKLVASKTPSERNTVSEYMVMGGFVYDEPFHQSLTQMVRDIFKRALGASRVKGWSWLFTGASRWYALGLLALLAMLIASILYGW
ncbi:MAG: hypothetical protein QXO22_07380 [Thermosphaera sp.]